MFVRLLGEMVEENEVICHAWVLMDNHYHLLLERNKGVRPTFNTLKGDCFLVVFGYVKTWTLQKEKTKR
jgi:REP element-mobilizing transposase RayT